MNPSLVSNDSIPSYSVSVFVCIYIFQTGYQLKRVKPVRSQLIRPIIPTVDSKCMIMNTFCWDFLCACMCCVSVLVVER